MKTVNLLLLIGIFLIGICCSKESPEPDPQNEWIETKNKLIGTWTDLNTFSCYTYVFTETDTIYWKADYWDESLTLTYQVVAEDSIKVTRNWKIEEAKKTSTHKLIFHSDDTFEIIKFLPTAASVSNWNDVTLYKFNCPEPDPQNEWIETKNKLIGTWIEFFPIDSLHTYVFTEADTIIRKSNWLNEILNHSYQVVAEDSIKVTRHWYMGNDGRNTSTNKLIFHTDDTLKIINFLAVDYGTSGWMHVTLYKIN